MTDNEAEELDLLRRELRQMGVPGPSKPEDVGIFFRPADSFFETSTQPQPQRARFSKRKWIPTVAVAAAAVVLGFAVLLPANEGPGVPAPPGTTSSPAIVTVASVLRQAAASSAAQPDQSEGRFWRVDSVQQQGSAPPENRTIWLGRREPGLVIDDFGRAELPPATFGLQRTQLTWDDLVALPADAVVLRARFDREVEGLANPGLSVAKLAAHLLAESPAPPELRRALWQVIAGVPGVRSRGVVKDARGREGIGLSLGTSQSSFADYVIDPHEGLILQATTRSGKPGGDTFRVTYLAQRAVDQLPARE